MDCSLELPLKGRIYNLSPCLRDPVFHLLKDRWRLAPWQCGLLFLVLYGALLPLALMDGNLYPRPGLDLSLFQDKVALVVYLLVVPVSAGLAMHFYTQVETSFERLFADRIVQATPEEYNRFLERLHLRYNSALCLLGGLVAAIAVYGWMIWDGEQDRRVAWNDLSAGAAAWYHLPIGLLVWYGAFTLCIKAIITAFAMRSIFRWPIELRPLHPDGCRGLKLLTDICVTLAAFLSLVALAVTLFISAGTPLFSLPVAVVLLFVLLTPTVFFTCLHGAHRVMKRAKDEALAQLDDMIERPYGELCAGMRERELDRDAAEEVLRVDSLHSFVRRWPVWPANTHITAQITLSVLLPLVLLALQILAEKTIR
jgi:hypothetical protein